MVTPDFAAGEKLPAAKLQQLGDIVTTHAPTLEASTTDPTLGTAPTQWSTIWINGQLVTMFFAIQFGTGSPTAGSGTYYIPMPAAYPILAGTYDLAAGEVRLVDDSTGNEAADMCIFDVANDRFYMRGTAGLVTDASPWTWATADSLLGRISWLTDFGA